MTTNGGHTVDQVVRVGQVQGEAWNTWDGRHVGCIKMEHMGWETCGVHKDGTHGMGDMWGA